MLWPLLRVGEEVDVGGNVVVDHEGKVGLGGGEIGVGLGHDVGIDDKGDVAGDFGGGVLPSWGRSRCPASGLPSRAR